MWAKVDKGWTEREFAEIELGDRRLERRTREVAEDLSSNPEAPINQASEDWAAAKAAYRLFDNDKISAEKILRPHQERTIQRMKGEAVVLVVQDTTYLNYSGYEDVSGLGPIGDSRSNAQGLIMHSALALTTGGLPLGFLTQKIWAREGYQDVKNARKNKSIESKESYRWIETLQKTCALAPKATQLVTVCDRESDICEFFVEAAHRHTSFVVRASWDRRLVDHEYSNLWELIESQKVAGRTTVVLPDRSISKEKTLNLDVRFSQVTLKAPNRCRRSDNKRLPTVTLFAVHVKEVNASSTSDPVEWLLLTNLPVQTVEQALEKVAWYTRRWSIEVFHRILKSGCTVERCKLETAQRLIRYLTLMSIVAWRIFWMTHIKRTTPAASATSVLTSHELHALPLLFKKPPYPTTKMPTVSQAIIAIARLGGFLARKGDKHPGPTAIWRGWQRLSDAAMIVGAIEAR